MIKETKPHAVLTDIRMKQITGLMVMEEIQKTDMDCMFIVLSAYRDFDYAQQACDLGAFAYLLKPIEDEKLRETMEAAYRTCMEQMEQEARYESWEKLLVKDGTSFQQVVVQNYVRDRLPEEKVEEVFRTLGDMPGNEERFITVYADIDVPTRSRITWIMKRPDSHFLKGWKKSWRAAISAGGLTGRRRAAHLSSAPRTKRRWES